MEEERSGVGFRLEQERSSGGLRGEVVVLQWRRGRGACGSDLGLDERAGAL